jgi:3-hydroxyacyl-CoA dehydrogenase
MGPIELADYVGLDTRKNFQHTLSSAIDYRKVQRALSEWRSKSNTEVSVELFREPDLLRQAVSQGKTGRSSGAGFMKY